MTWHVITRYTDSRAVKGDRLKICCISFAGSNPASCISDETTLKVLKPG